MKRRDFIAFLGGAAAAPLASPRAASAQPGKLWRIGVLEPIPAAQNANLDALRNGLRDLGYVEGQNLEFHYRSADGRTERFPALAAELLRLRVDLIVTRGTPAVMAAKDATTTIPIVMAASGDPLGTGVIAGLARPGANVTGLSAFTTELLGKRVELLREVVPTVSRTGLLHNLQNPVARRQWEEMKSAAQRLRLEPVLLDVQSGDLERAFEIAVAQKADSLIVGNDTVMHTHRQQVVALAANLRVPATYAAREFVDAGGLMVYGVSYPDLYRRAATLIDKIFKGAKPASLPIEQPTKFELIVNLKTAKALGLKIPESFLLRATEVIE